MGGQWERQQGRPHIGDNRGYHGEMTGDTMCGTKTPQGTPHVIPCCLPNACQSRETTVDTTCHLLVQRHHKGQHMSSPHHLLVQRNNRGLHTGETTWDMWEITGDDVVSQEDREDHGDTMHHLLCHPPQGDHVLSPSRPPRGDHMSSPSDRPHVVPAVVPPQGRLQVIPLWETMCHPPQGDHMYPLRETTLGTPHGEMTLGTHGETTLGTPHWT